MSRTIKILIRALVDDILSKSIYKYGDRKYNKNNGFETALLEKHMKK